MAEHPRTSILGTGAIGTAITHRLLTAGHHVTIWNRTPHRTTHLTTAGAHPARTAAEALTASPLALLTVTDHTAARDCLTGDLTGHTIVTLCTGGPDDARTIARHVTALGGHYLDAGLQATPDTLGTTAIPYSGSRHAFDQHTATLSRLGTRHFAGEQPHTAAIWDLALLGLWYDAQLGLLRALDTARTAGADPAAFATAAATQLAHVVTAIPATTTELRDRTYPPGPATLPEHLTVLRQLTHLRTGATLGDGGLTTVTTHIETLIAAGLRTEGLTATIDATPPPAP